MLLAVFSLVCAKLLVKCLALLIRQRGKEQCWKSWKVSESCTYSSATAKHQKNKQKIPWTFSYYTHILNGQWVIHIYKIINGHKMNPSERNTSVIWFLFMMTWSKAQVWIFSNLDAFEIQVWMGIFMMMTLFTYHFSKQRGFYLP